MSYFYPLLLNINYNRLFHRINLFIVQFNQTKFYSESIHFELIGIHISKIEYINIANEDHSCTICTVKCSEKKNTSIHINHFQSHITHHTVTQIKRKYKKTIQ